ncbi:DUF58 domain-containing protein [Symmachiella dynata]|uniref:DUF58 domain-containing protein n=1 Tax=Symmachiella dynata TaxID=2527995 RepID=A0A517ZGS9_9PLAN|nr:DUF58 domain-containing protein [Symmachiella dynata]QDT46108.1 hypothetical protein Pan258_01250 [Symmachiella dynata]QDU41674.1 hypothetical protein Mal52_01270 [Symmachiella dynata]
MFPDGNRREFLDPSALSRLSGLPLFARRPMMGSVSGRHPSPHRGASVEFAEYRKYVPGDDLRRLDWRAYGRTDRFYVKEFEADTNLRCCLVLDTSGSMDFGSGDITKLQYARKIAGALSYLAVQQGDAIGLSCVAENMIQNIPPRRNPAHLMHVFDTLEKAVPKDGTQLTSVLHELAETIRQRALIVIISDFFVEPAELRSCFEHLQFRKHDVTAFHLLDPQELGFEFRRPMRFLDMEGGPAIFAEPNEIADRYHKALQEYLENLKQVVLQTGIDYHRTVIDEDYEKVLTQFLAGRTRARGVR